MAFGHIGVCHHGWKAGDQFDALPQNIFNGYVVGIVVKRVQRENIARQFIHDIRAGRLENHVLGKSQRQLAIGGQKPTEPIQLRRGGQLAENQQIGHFLKAITLIMEESVDQIIDGYSTVKQTAFDRDAVIVIHDIGKNLADFGQADQHTGASSLRDRQL